uniref:calcium-binding protein n=1 Tax=Paracoccus seriniphilus TaxID=184748 RepID=UPI00356B160F
TDWLNTTTFNGNYNVNMTTGATNFAGESFTQFENIYMGSGNDTVTGTTGANRIYGNSGNDRIDGRAGNDYISGGAGNDNLTGGGGRDTVYGGSGNDTIHSSGNGIYDGGSGNDYVYAGLGSAETLRGGSGTDWLNTTSFNGDYNINLATGSTNYTGESFTGFEYLRSGNGDDRLTGTSSANAIYGGGGEDTVFGGAGNDYLYGQNGDDNLYGQSGHDRMYGNSGDDQMSGGRGHDYVHGGTGDDDLEGNRGDDTLAGGQGADTLTGGSGEDTFRFFSTSESPFGSSGNYDRITDFQGAGINPVSATEDKIDLSSIDANTGLAGDQAFTFNGTSNGGAGTIWMQNVGGETWLRVNTDADSAPEMTIRILDGADDANDYWAGDFIL